MRAQLSRLLACAGGHSLRGLPSVVLQTACTMFPRSRSLVAESSRKCDLTTTNRVRWGHAIIVIHTTSAPRSCANQADEPRSDDRSCQLSSELESSRACGTLMTSVLGRTSVSRREHSKTHSSHEFRCRKDLSSMACFLHFARAPLEPHQHMVVSAQSGGWRLLVTRRRAADNWPIVGLYHS